MPIYIILCTFQTPPPTPQTFPLTKVSAAFYIINRLLNSSHSVPFARKLIFPIYDKKSAFAVFLLRYCLFYKIKKRLKQAVLTHHKQISHLASKASLSGLFCNFSRYVKLCGGAECAKNKPGTILYLI